MLLRLVWRLDLDRDLQMRHLRVARILDPMPTACWSVNLTDPEPPVEHL